MIPSVSDSLRNQFLIATHCLETGIFKSSVTYICEHNEDGAMGIIINRPSRLSLQDILTDVCESNAATPNPVENTAPVMVGGPVGLERGFVLHQLTDDEDASCWSSSLHVTKRTCKILPWTSLAKAKQKRPDNTFVTEAFFRLNPVGLIEINGYWYVFAPDFPIKFGFDYVFCGPLGVLIA